MKIRHLLTTLAAAMAMCMAPPGMTADDDDGDSYKVSGRFAVLYGFEDFNDNNKDRGGDLEFYEFVVNFDAKVSDVLLSVEYHFYPAYDFDAPRHAWIGYDIGNWRTKFGLVKQPFGILPYATHNWWFGFNYFVGLEDQYDLGVSTESLGDGPHRWHFAYFKEAELGNRLGRYSYDLVENTVTDAAGDIDVAQSQFNRQSHRGAARYAYVMEHAGGSSEFGASGMLGRVFNSFTEENGSNWAAALHYHGQYGPWSLMAQAARYAYSPRNPDGVDRRSVFGSVLGVPYEIPAKAGVYMANVAYTLPVSFGPVTAVQFYNDFSVLDKSESDFSSSTLNTTGALVMAGPVLAWFDFVQGRNAPFLDTDIVRGGGRVHRRFNIWVGYMF